MMATTRRTSPSLRWRCCPRRDGVVAIADLRRRLAVVDDDGDGATGDKVNDDGNDATGDDIDNDGEGATYNDIDDDCDGTTGDEVDNDCNGATGDKVNDADDNVRRR
jgi:hypothetical protein